MTLESSGSETELETPELETSELETSEPDTPELETHLSDKLEPIKVAKVEFDPSRVKFIDLARSEVAVKYAWSTGKLPPVLTRFPNLEVLKAERLGLIVIDEWILQLKHLKQLFLAGNEITTWPQHLALLENLTTITMEGNPCLELQFRKSSSFRDAFFHLKGSNKQQKDLTLFVRAYDRTPVLPKRSLFNTANDIYRGGIYRQRFPDQAEKQEDFMTTMGPSRLESRKMEPPPLLSGNILGTSDALFMDSLTLTEKDVQERSNLIMELLAGITTTSGLYTPFDGMPVKYQVPETLGKYLNDGKPDFRKALVKFISEEHSYVLRLQEVVQLFLAPTVPDTFVKELAGIFDTFPEMYFAHSHDTLPALNKFYRKSLKRKVPDFVKFSNKMMELFDAKRFDCYIEYAHGLIMSQWKLWHSIDPDLQYNEPSPRNSIGRMGEWLNKEALENNLHALDHAVDYLILPFKRLGEYCEYFKEISNHYPESIKLYHRFRDLRHKVQSIIEGARQNLRLQRLCKHYKLTKERSLLRGYQWDALVQVLFRVYLDEGSYRNKTHDILTSRNDSRMVMSVVSQVFHQGERKLRLIFCDEDVQIWDEGLGKMVAVVKPHTISAEKGKDLRLTFESADETLTCTLLSFAAIDSNAGEGVDGFVEALGKARLASKLGQDTDTGSLMSTSRSVLGKEYSHLS